MDQEILSFAQEIALEAGKILFKGFRSDHTVISYKSRTDIVTNIDRESEEFLYSAISKKFPNHSIIAEEGSRKDTLGDYIWYVDPLDGTNNFAHGIPFFSVSIGVYSKKKEEMTAGIVYNPVLKELFSAVHSRGAHLNDEPISVSRIGDIGIALLATGFPYDKEDSDKNNTKEFNAFLPQIQGIRRLGSASIDLCYVSAGRFDGYWEGGLHPWDIAAGSLIVAEAGGSVTRYDGSRFNPEHPAILATNGLIHLDMIEILSRAHGAG